MHVKTVGAIVGVNGLHMHVKTVGAIVGVKPRYPWVPSGLLMCMAVRSCKMKLLIQKRCNEFSIIKSIIYSGVGAAPHMREQHGGIRVIVRTLSDSRDPASLGKQPDFDPESDSDGVRGRPYRRVRKGHLGRLPSGKGNQGDRSLGLNHLGTHCKFPNTRSATARCTQQHSRRRFAEPLVCIHTRVSAESAPHTHQPE